MPIRWYVYTVLNLISAFRPLGSENLLLRGATLKNTEYIYGNKNAFPAILAISKQQQANKVYRVLVIGIVFFMLRILSHFRVEYFPLTEPLKGFIPFILQKLAKNRSKANSSSLRTFICGKLTKHWHKWLLRCILNKHSLIENSS